MYQLIATALKHGMRVKPAELGFENRDPGFGNS